MSSVSIAGDTSGSILLQAPAVAGSSTITLPTTGGTIRTTTTSGTILQVVQTTKTDIWSTNSLGSQWNDIPGQGGSGTFQVQITPSSSSNRILIMSHVPMSSTDGQVARAQLQRNGTPIFTGDTAGSRPLGLSQIYWSPAAWGGQSSICVINLGGTYVDSPATTSTLTYKIVVGADNTGGTGTARINTTVRDGNNAGYDTRTAASIIAMEIAG